MTNLNLAPKSGKWEDRQELNINDKKSELPVELSFDDKNGTFRITTKITTVQVSRNPDVRAGLLETLCKMLDKAMIDGLQLRDDWVSNNPERQDPDQLDMFDGIEADNNEHEPQLSLTAQKKGKKPTGKKAAEVEESDFADDSTLSDDLPM